MALQYKNGKPYYYRNKRLNGQVVTQYYGSGVEAELAAEVFAAAKEKRKLNREKLDAAKAGLKLLDRQMDQLKKAPLHALDAERSEQSARDSGQLASQPTPETVLDRARELLAARETGDQTAESELTGLLDRFPGLMHRMGDAAGLARAKWVSLIVGKDPVFMAATVKKLEHMRSQYPVDGSPVGKLLVERILATWLQLTFFEGKMAAVNQNDFKTFGFFCSRQQKAHRQHLQAIRAWVQWRAACDSIN